MGGSQREERLEVLERRIEEVGLEKEAYWWQGLTLFSST